jgi:hypothetical protein
LSPSRGGIYGAEKANEFHTVSDVDGNSILVPYDLFMTLLLLLDLARRLRFPQPIGSKELVSAAAAEHGVNRRRQGYSSAMMVEESRMLQVSVFHTLQKNLARIDFSILLTEVMTIADEIDSQLSQAMTSFAAESVRDALPA